jgi:hypothetical protein
VATSASADPQINPGANRRIELLTFNPFGSAQDKLVSCQVLIKSCHIYSHIPVVIMKPGD